MTTRDGPAAGLDIDQARLASPAAWVASRTPPAPSELRAHLARDLADASPTGGVADALLNACTAAMDRVLAATDDSLETALDLLSADAYVTYAFEAAAEDPDRVAAFADQAMRRISARATTHMERA